MNPLGNLELGLATNISGRLFEAYSSMVTILREETIIENEKETLISGSYYGCARGTSPKINKNS